MPVNFQYVQLSDYTFASCVIVYCLAMVLLLAQLASPLSSAVSAQSPQYSTEKTPGIVLTDTHTPIAIRLGNMGYNVAIVGLGLHIISIILRGIATHRVPWGNMFEFINLACVVAEIIAITILRSSQLRPLLGLALIPTVILLFIAGTYLYATAAPVVPALKSYWLIIHVSIISAGSGVFMISGVCSLAIILIHFSPRYSPRWKAIISRLPTIGTLDNIAYTLVKFAFPLFTVGVIFGAIWAESAWGRYWGWDPKETAAFITWVCYAAYLHARATAGWKKISIAYINVVGFAAVLINLFVINLVTSGLHSYAGVN